MGNSAVVTSLPKDYRALSLCPLSSVAHYQLSDVIWRSRKHFRTQRMVAENSHLSYDALCNRAVLYISVSASIIVTLQVYYKKA